MKLYWLPLSPNNFPISALADHLGIPLERQRLDPAKGETRSPEFLKLNPNGKCPVLVDGDYVLWESNSILIYLAGKKPDAGLWPADELARIDITRWLIWQQAHWMRGCGTLFWERLLKGLFGAGAPNPEKEKEGEDAVRFYGKVLDGCLEGKKFLTGDSLTIADFSVAAPLPLAAAARLPLDGFSNIERWYGQIAALEAWQKNIPKPFRP
ncbi:MAG: glutathione S-transferase family protein [Deltaproteobacteria bacterium]|nr:glutathione S-transferase family protein [Deltaproteobacteria bacterium]